MATTKRPPSAASTQWKLVAAIAAGMLVFAALGLAAFVLFVRSIVDTPEAASPLRQAETFAKTHSQNECVTEGLERSRPCWGFTCRVSIGLFVDRCVALAAPSPELCGEAPEPTFGNSLRTSNWSQRECAKRGQRKFVFMCPQLLQGAATACWERSSSARASATR